MTRTELYAMITKAMRDCRPLNTPGEWMEGKRAGWYAACDALAHEFAVHHVGFNRDRFLRECESEPGTRGDLYTPAAKLLLRCVQMHGRDKVVELLVRHGASMAKPRLSDVPVDQLPALCNALATLEQRE